MRAGNQRSILNIVEKRSFAYIDTGNATIRLHGFARRLMRGLLDELGEEFNYELNLLRLPSAALH